MAQLPFRKTIGGLLGEIVIWLRPGAIADPDKMFAANTLCQRLAKAAIYRRAILTQNQSALEELHRKYWASQEADTFFQNIRERALDQLLTHHADMLDWLVELLKAQPGKFQSLCEIGSGNGRVLNHLAQTLPGIDTFVGVDISSRQTARTREAYPDPKLNFVAADGLEWLEAHASPGMILSTNGGVLEYFTEARLRRVFEILSTRAAPAAIALIEPIGDDFNLASEEHSRPWGQELSFSHNYPLLARQAGLEILHQKDATYPFGRRLMLLAASRKA